MTEQVLPYDPVTFKRRPPAPGTDATQNDAYKRATDPAETARDFSRPHTIPKYEYEGVTGRDHAKDCAEWQAREDKRIADAAALHASLYGN